MENQDANEKEFNFILYSNSKLHDSFQETTEKIYDLEEQIKKVPPDGPTLEYNPPGFNKSKSLGTNQERVAKLNSEIASNKSKFIQQLKGSLKDMDSSKQEKLLEVASSRVSWGVTRIREEKESLKKNQTASQRFTRSLNYTRNLERVEFRANARDASKDKSKDE